MRELFDENFDDLSLVDLVGIIEIRDQLKLAESRINEDNFKEASCELAKAKTLIFEKLQKFIPKIENGLGDGASCKTPG